jgi:hypothetical protein
MSASMYEVFHWGNSECPKKLAFSIAGSSIDIDEPRSNKNSMTVKGEDRAFLIIIYQIELFMIFRVVRFYGAILL